MTREPLSPERLASYHAYTRKHSVNWPLYHLARLFLLPFFLVYFRMDRRGREYGRVKGGVIVASNHRSFLDPFVAGACLPWRRPMNYMAKVELFERRWQGWMLSRLGAFPVRRGESDEDSMLTARMIAERGGAVCLFPEGTRIRRGTLANPKRGVGRLALQTGAVVIPTAVLGTEEVRRGWRIRPRRVKVRMGPPMTFPRAEEPSPALAETVTARIWPNVLLQWEDLGGLPPMRRAAVIGAGSWGTAVAVLLARGGLEVQLGARSAERVEELIEDGENRRYLPGVPLPESIDVRPASAIELAGLDLICMAIPSAQLPQAVGAIADRVSSRSAVLMLTKGLISPQGQLPSEYVGERVRARGIACLGGPAHAREAVSGSAALVLGSADEELRVQIGEVFDRAGLVCERSRDVIGVEMAGAGKNAAALAAAAAEPHGLNAAGIAVAAIWRECIDHAVARGAEPETFAGLAGVGDLTATMMAPSGRNRRAGELLGTGTPAAEIPGKIGQASEGLDTVPILAEAVATSGVEAPALGALAALIGGEIDAEEWMASLRAVERQRQAA
ncbi:MAG TPA: 1-acyl-sn-glycerol-3-phosphate acyltransferase [Solirubrobacterales bacterium]|nr:1-acyl-sn-glycerol-3-phosphate acyltransferase [Solirubrobacterales bacterium]